MQKRWLRGEAIPRRCREPRLLRYSEVGRLGKHFGPLIEVRGRERCFPILFDDFRADPLRVYRALLDFARLPDDGRTEIGHKNQARAFRKQWLQPLVMDPPTPMARLSFQSMDIRGCARSCVRAVRRPLPAEFRRELSDCFRDDVAELGHLLRRSVGLPGAASLERSRNFRPPLMLWRINQERDMAKTQSTRKRAGASKSRSKSSSSSGRSRARSSSRSKGASRSRTASRRRSDASQRQQDAIALLRADHKTVSDMFDEYERRKERLSPDKKLEMVQTICRELEVHAQIEEEIFYPAARQAVREEDLLDEAEVEHGSAKELIRQLQGGQPGDELYDAKVKVLGEYVKHHVKEEQGQLFPMVKKSRLDLRGLGEELMRRKQELMGGGEPGME